MRGIKGAHTDTRTSHSLRSVATWTGAVVAASGVLTDLIVSALMSSISALIDVYSRPQKDEVVVVVVFVFTVFPNCLNIFPKTIAEFLITLN